MATATTNSPGLRGNSVVVDLLAAAITAIEAATIATGTVGAPSAAVISVQSPAATEVAVTFSTDTSAYASGDVIADTQEIALALPVNAGSAFLDTLTLVDQDDQGVAMKIIILRSNVSLGTENAAPDIDDTEALEILQVIDIASTDWTDLGVVRVATPYIPFRRLKGVSGSRSLWVAILNGSGAPTFTASGLKAQFGFSPI